MERLWNIVHYFAYRADYKLHMSFSKIEPVGFLLKILFSVPFIKNAYLKKGITLETINNAVDDAFKRTDIGISSIFAGGIMYVLPVFFFTGIILIFISFMEVKPKRFTPFLTIYIVLIVISFLLNYLLLFNKNKYLKYFKEFSKKPKKWKLKCAIISMGVIFFVFLLLVLGFISNL